MALRQLAAPSTTARPRGASFGSDVSDEDKTKIQPTTASVSTTAAPSLVRRASSKRWYSDSDDEGGGGDDNYANNQAGSMSSLQASSIALAASSSTSVMHRRASASAFIPSRAGTITEKAPPPPALDLTAPPATGSLPDIPRPVSGFHKLVQKTKILSPFRSKSSKHLNGAAANQPHDDHPPDSAPVASSAGPVLQRRHSSRMILRASSTDTPLAPTPEDEPDDAFQLNVLQYGLRGLKAWNSRYFVLFKNPNEMRYYTDVVQSGWGPIPLNELGCISLRSIQRISKPSHPKYKGALKALITQNNIRQKAALGGVASFLNQCAIEQRKPTRNEWEDELDVVTAGAVVMLWLSQLQGPIVPVDMYHAFRHVMAEGATAPFELMRNLKTGDRLDPARRGKGLLCKIIDVLVLQPADSIYRFWLASCVESFLRRSSPAEQLFVARTPLLAALLKEILSCGFRPSGSLQSAFDLLGEMTKNNPTTLTHPRTSAMFPSLARLFEFLQLNSVRLLRHLMTIVTLDDINHENICCLNTAVVMLVFEHRQRRLPRMLEALRQLQTEVDDGNTDLCVNFRSLLWFWVQYYVPRGRDRLSLEHSSDMKFSEWYSVVALLCADDGSPAALLPAPTLLPASPYVVHHMSSGPRASSSHHPYPYPSRRM
ncbi:hypothetical protein DYB25_010678 [Aphanomyces astaci]|uniref:Uncharacterized protein n=1 Tax=Aphanomyces astaci TaxID=112090 RepID=A0A397ADT9_APHAT|nr:hypothetical protein DYB25_010678 [Aphanomyces astaci]